MTGRLAKGRVLLDGEPLAQWNKAALARRRAVLPQHSAVAFDFTGLQIAALGLLAHRDRLSERQMRALAEQALAETEALAFADRPYTVLSGGERQRVQLARVLAQCDADPAAGPSCCSTSRSPASTLPTSTPRSASARRRADRGLGVLAVLHDLNMAARYADRVGHRRKRPADRTGADRNHARSGPVVGGVRYTHRATGGCRDPGLPQSRSYVVKLFRLGHKPAGIT